MGKYVTREMGDVGSATQSTEVNVEDLEHFSFHIHGTFVGTVQPQISHDGTAWVDFGSPVTAPAHIPFATYGLPHDAKAARVDVTAYTSGTIESDVAGRDADRKG